MRGGKCELSGESEGWVERGERSRVRGDMSEICGESKYMRC